MTELAKTLARLEAERAQAHNEFEDARVRNQEKRERKLNEELGKLDMAIEGTRKQLEALKGMAEFIEISNLKKQQEQERIQTLQDLFGGRDGGAAQRKIFGSFSAAALAAQHGPAAESPTAKQIREFRAEERARHRELILEIRKQKQLGA